MAESEQNSVGNEPELQHFSGEAPEMENMNVNEAEQQDFVIGEPAKEAVCESEKQNSNSNDLENVVVNGNESDKAVSVNESAQNIPEGEADPGDAVEESERDLLGKDTDTNLAVNEENDVGVVSDNVHHEVRQETDSVASTGEEKKWPGWPGESVFRMLVPGQKVGNIIGRKGEYIKKIVEETKARVKILDGPPGTSERAVMVSAKEEPDASIPPAVEGLLRVHKRIVDGLEGDGSNPPPAAGGKVSTKMLVPATQAGSLIGKQGATVKIVQESSNCIVRVLSAEDLPIFALQDDRVVEVVGEPADVHKAMELIALHLRKFLVDRSIIPLFEAQMQSPKTHMDHMPPQASWGPPHGLPPSAGPGPGFGPTSHYMRPPRQLDNYYPPADMMPPSERPPHQGISAYGREPAMNIHASSNPQPASTMITQVTQHMQIPLSYADAVIGTSGSTISYIRRSSGATVTIQESRGAPGEMTVEISGTASQVQAAQQLIQNFMAGAGAPTPTQAGGVADQGYNQGYSSYAAPPGTAYGSSATSTGYASQPGGYGSVYGGSYGY